MPEGPSIVIVKEAVHIFRKKKIIAVSGNSKIDQPRLLNQSVTDFKSHGKHFLICFKGFSLRVHFLLFGSYRINETKEATPRLHLKFSKGELNLYACSVKFIEGDINEAYDWTSDVMNEDWDPKSALKKLRQQPEMMACDALLNQEIFAGVGNIIKNEVLYRIKIHPASLCGEIPAPKLRTMTAEARKYSFQFLEWKKKFELKQHWLAHTKKTCLRCDLPLIKEHLGKTNRRTFYCSNCQILYK